jgi:hypothetical protein
MFTLEIGSNVLTGFVIGVVTYLVIRWWGYRATRRP